MAKIVHHHFIFKISFFHRQIYQFQVHTKTKFSQLFNQTFDQKMKIHHRHLLHHLNNKKKQGRESSNERTPRKMLYMLHPFHQLPSYSQKIGWHTNINQYMVEKVLPTKAHWESLSTWWHRKCWSVLRMTILFHIYKYIFFLLKTFHIFKRVQDTFLLLRVCKDFIYETFFIAVDHALLPLII